MAQAEEDAGAPFRPENLQRLAQIRAERLDLYEGLLAKLKNPKTIRTGELDRAVKKLVQAHDDTLQGQKLVLDPPEPWHETVDGAELLDEMVANVRRYVVLPDHCAEIVALWCLYTHCVDAFNYAPRLAFIAPEKDCGKSTALSVVQQLVNKPLTSSNTTPAVVFRVIEFAQPTLLVDEADTATVVVSRYTATSGRAPPISGITAATCSGENRFGVAVGCIKKPRFLWFVAA